MNHEDEAGEGSPVVWLTTEDEAAESGELEAKNTKDGLPYVAPLNAFLR